MNSGKGRSKLKVREPYGRVTDIYQVPVALHEIRELSNYPNSAIGDNEQSLKLLMKIRVLIESIIAVTSANPGCLTNLAEWPKCYGCDAALAFIWTDQETGRKNPYCSDCDDKLIQDVELPNRKMATMA